MNKIIRYERTKGTCEHFQCARSTLWNWVRKRPGFPQPIRSGPRHRLFDIDAIESFIKEESKEGGK